MISAATYALLSGGAYWDVRRQDFNEAPLPAGWKALTQFDRSESGPNATALGSGFSARVYQSTSGEIVIAYAGTEFGSTVTGLVNDFLSGNVPLAAGWSSEQAYQAALLYQEVKAWAGGSGNITFTGHSLGGGLAGLMGVWFNRPATVFAPAPFEHRSALANGGCAGTSRYGDGRGSAPTAMPASKPTPQQVMAGTCA